MPKRLCFATLLVMVQTDQPPKIPLKNFKRTKMIATLGPSTSEFEMIRDLLKAGVNGFRLNFSHGNFEEHLDRIKKIRQASVELDKPVAIIQDLQGPKMRLGDFDDIIPVKKGQELVLKYKTDYQTTGLIPTQYDLSKKVKRGERLLISDGRLKTEVTSVQDGKVHIKANNDGVLTRRKGINLPDTDLGGDIITKKDREDIVFGAEHNVDYVALSFVQTGEDVKKLKRLLSLYGSKSLVIAKIETKAATEHLDEIIDESDAVMIARGDLAQETLTEAVPVLQRAIIGKCLEKGKISIVATQMLASMTDELEPTRAEVSDVATAVIVGADTVMLSDETASGKHPLEAVEVMKRIILYTQENSPLKPVFFNQATPSVQAAISSSVITLAGRLGAKAIVTITRSGRTTKSVAMHRPNVPIIAVTSHAMTAQQLAIVYGTKGFIRPENEASAQRLTDWLRSHAVFKSKDVIVTAIDMHPEQFEGMDTIKVRKLE